VGDQVEFRSKLAVAFGACPRCHTLDRVDDTGQHITIFTCQDCGHSWTIRLRPDPEPLSAERNAQRIQVIQETYNICAEALLLLAVCPSHQVNSRMLTVQQSALDTVNYLFGFEGRKTVMVGRRLNERA
jgi:Zn ribbon nucleic-acid-binding protein